MLIPEGLDEELVIPTIETGIPFLVKRYHQNKKGSPGRDAEIVRPEHKIGVVFHRDGSGGRRLLNDVSKIEMLISEDLVDVKEMRNSELRILSLESLIDVNGNLDGQYASIARSGQRTGVLCH